MNKAGVLLVMALLFLLAACSANSQTGNASEPQQAAESAMPLKIAVLHASSQCGPAATTQWIASQEQFAALFQAAQAQMISPAPPQPPAVDFSQYGVLLVSMGQQRSGGYAIKPAREELIITNGSAELAIHWQEPGPGMMVIQVITHPCIFIKVPRGNYQTLRIVDQDNKVRAELAVN
jgi:hypothetical protein